MADLDNYAYPLATRLRTEDLVSVWCTKSHSAHSRVLVAAADETAAPSAIYTVRTTASTQTRAYKAEIRSAESRATEENGRAEGRERVGTYCVSHGLDQSLKKNNNTTITDNRSPTNN